METLRDTWLTTGSMAHTLQNAGEILYCLAESVKYSAPAMEEALGSP